MLAAQLENELLRPTTMHALTDSFGGYIVEEILIENANVDRKKVKDVPFHPSGSLVVLKREEEIIIPHGDTKLMRGDRITVIGNSEALEEFRTVFK